MDRRDFFRNTAVIAAAQGVGLKAFANVLEDDGKAQQAKQEQQPLINSEPMLQNYAETSIGVAFSVTDMANGYVVFGEKEDLSDGRKVYCGGYRMTDMNNDCMLVRLTGLKPATRYYYRIGADRISYKGGYNMKVKENVERETIYSFRTAGKAAEPHFCVINDTHAQWDSFGKVIDKVHELNPSCVVWNGDACNTEETVEDQKQIFLYPAISRRDYASRIPFLFSPGNHDGRGLANRHLERIWMYRQPEERDSRYWDLGRNYAVRMGDIALIGLDTAEDKMDTNPKFANLYNSGPYREAQALWLADALRQKEISSAKFLVAICHIPLYDPRPNANPGDIAPDDKDPAYSTDFAAWQRTCARLWTPLLEKAKCQLVITAHQHHYRYYAANKERPWAEIVGGSPDCTPEKPKNFPTVIEGRVEDGRLRIDVHNILTGEVKETLYFEAR